VGEFGFPAQCEVVNLSVFAHNHGSFEQFREQSLQGIEGEVETKETRPGDYSRGGHLGAIVARGLPVYGRGSCGAGIGAGRYGGGGVSHGEAVLV
jgi:hypothetical protein